MVELNASFEENAQTIDAGMGESIEVIPLLIEDDKISDKSAWSSKNTVDKLCPSFNESGDTVTCEPLEGLPLEVVSHIVPKQAGSGDPSLTNIRPITGYDSIKLSRTGKNLFGDVALADAIVSSGGKKDASNGTVTFSPGSNRFFSNLKENTQYTAILYGSNTWNGAVSNLCFRYTDGAYSTIPFDNTTPNEKAYACFTSYAGRSVLSFGRVDVGGTTTLEYDKCGLFEGVISLEDFEPYKGDTFTIDLGQTVYGGSFNWKTGELTIDRETTVLDGNSTKFRYITTVNGRTLCVAYIKATSNQAVICSHLVTSKTTNYGDVYSAGTSWNELYAYIQPFADVQEANAWLAEQYANGTPFTVCYELRDRITVQLTPQEILALAGTNCIFSNTGNTEVKGKADPAAIIEKLTNAIISLGGNV